MATGLVAFFGIDALAQIRTNRKASVDIAEGLLVGLDINGEWVVADRVGGGTPIVAKSIIVGGSEDVFGLGVEYVKDSVLRAGKSQDKEVYAIIDMPEGTFTNAQIGNKVWLSTGGEFEYTPTVTSTELAQEVGVIYSTSAIQIDLTNDTEGTIIV